MTDLVAVVGNELLPFPVATLEAETIRLATAELSREELSKYANPRALPLKDPQLVVYLHGDQKQAILKLTPSTEERTVIQELIQFLQLWNKYHLIGFDELVGKMIDHFTSRVAHDNDVFWAGMKDDMTATLNRRSFKVEDIRVTEANRSVVNDLRNQIQEAKERIADLGVEYPINFAKKDRKYVDVGEFLMSPLDPSKYYDTITKDDYLWIFRSAQLLGNKSILVRLFTVICCSYRYYHLNLNVEVVTAMRKLAMPAVLSTYVGYMLYLAYKDPGA